MGFSCAMCHTRVMPNGSIVKGAQGNFPMGRADAYFARHVMLPGATNEAKRAEVKAFLRRLTVAAFHLPRQQPSVVDWFDHLSLEEIVAQGEDMEVPASVVSRQGTSPLSPVKIPDLIGVKDRRYLDHTGLIRHRGPGDLMRYAALNQGADQLARYGGFRPIEAISGKLPEDPASDETFERYSDLQLYALAKYLYSLTPPPNPNLPNTTEQQALVKRGEEIFNDSDNRCATCHKPPLYTNNKLTPALGFKVPDDHPESTNIMSSSVGTDPRLATQTRRGTGFYNVPSLLGVWYRGPFEHNGSCATLEDWFGAALAPLRLRPDWKGPLAAPKPVEAGPGTKTRTAMDHGFGLEFPRDVRKTLIAFLKTF